MRGETSKSVNLSASICFCKMGGIGLPGSSVLKNWLVNAGDAGSISGSGRSLGEGNGYPLQYSCLGNPTDR